MVVFTLIQQEKISGSKQKILGIYSSWINAWKFFAQRVQQNRNPFTTGIFRYNNAAMFEGAVSQMNYNAKSILIYTHDLFDVSIIRIDIDKPIAL